ncbi:hypothetical protein CAPTEDRAFT_143013 [Capitella teleta]|uniref:Cytochrome P450 n=1 Tax=Capitella teleta TaxID=283909 RepID=R7TRH9_CAPTE|nr:hypothetical protein CAPTEDRAFT_143013 [Capitella teleta]|eukprot:ELT96518.1 hypothetical protein CAPTEDRAFT_143013 [Capitella teleta]
MKGGQVVRKEKKLKPFKDIPGPKGLPVIGTLLEFTKKDGLKFNKMFEVMTSRSKEFGPVYKERIGMIESVIVSDPHEYAKVIQVDGKHPHRIELFPMVHYRQKKKMALGTVNAQGEEWYRGRMVLSKVMLKPKEVQDYVIAQSDVGNDFIRHMKSIVSSDGQLISFEREIFKWALESICVVLFEERIGCFPNPPTEKAQEFITNLIGFFKYMQPLMYNFPMYKIYPTKTWRQYEKHGDIVVGIGLDMVRKVKKESKSEFLTYLLAQKSLSPVEANSHAVDLMMGAVETTANSMMWMLYCLSNFPDAQRKLQEEIDKIVPQDERITPEVLSKMKYTKACLKETFRLFPITFATSRMIHEEIELGGYHIPKGTHCQANLWGMGRDPDYFSDPLTFKPERWLRDIQTLEHHNPHAVLPFGHGARMCIGLRFAEQEIYIAVAKLMKHFTVKHEGELLPVLNTVMTPDRPVNFRFLLRTKPALSGLGDTKKPIAVELK